MAEPKKNEAFTWIFKMVDATDFATPEPGVSPTVKISKDGATSLSGLTGSPTVTEIGNADSAGLYKVTVDQADMNADTVILWASAAGCAQVTEIFYLTTKRVSELVDFDPTASNVTIADGHITAAKIAASAAEKAADILVRRSMASIRASSNGDAPSKRSLLAMLSLFCNKVDLSSGDLEAFEEDDTTSFFTQDLTSDAAADPIVTKVPL